MKRTLAFAVVAVVFTATSCDSLARFTHVPSTPNGVSSARHNDKQGEPGSVGWQPLAPGQQYRVWIHDPSLANGCNETNTEAPEIDNNGALCKSVVP